MLQRRIWPAICMLILVLTFMKPAAVEACSCVAAPSVEGQFDIMTAVFSGTVVSIIDPPLKKVMSSADPVTIVFHVDKVWKGEVEETTRIYTAQDGTSCGYEHFAVGQDFLVMASPNGNGGLTTGLCSATMKLSQAGAEITALGEGYAPVKNASEKSSTGRNEWAVPAISSSVILLIVLTALILLISRRNKKV